jgi:hypothetical protein
MYYYYIIRKTKAGKYEVDILDVDASTDVKVKPLYTAPSSIPSSTEVHPIFEESDIEAGNIAIIMFTILTSNTDILISSY